MDEAESLSKMGVTFGKPKIDVDTIRQHKDKIVLQLNNGIASMAKARKSNSSKVVPLSFLIQVQVSHEDKNQTITYDYCIIAAGSSSSMLPNIPKNKNILTSRTALILKTFEDMLIIGGGVIGVELGQVYATLGSQVSLVEFLPSDSRADRDIVKPLERKLKNNLKLSCLVQRS